MGPLACGLVDGIQVLRSLLRIGIRLVGDGLEQAHGVVGGVRQVFFAVTGGGDGHDGVHHEPGVFVFFRLKKAACTSQAAENQKRC